MQMKLINDYNQPHDNDYNQPHDNDYNQPHDNDYNQPHDNDYNQPHDNNFNQPHDNDYNQPHDNDAPSMLVPELWYKEQLFLPNVMQRGRGSGRHVGEEILHL
jgi:hypothetical protein